MRIATKSPPMTTKSLFQGLQIVCDFCSRIFETEFIEANLKAI